MEPTNTVRVCKVCGVKYLDSANNFKHIHRHDGMCPECSKKYK